MATKSSKANGDKNAKNSCDICGIQGLMPFNFKEHMDGKKHKHQLLLHNGISKKEGKKPKKIKLKTKEKVIFANQGENLPDKVNELNEANSHTADYYNVEFSEKDYHHNRYSNSRETRNSQYMDRNDRHFRKPFLLPYPHNVNPYAFKNSNYYYGHSSRENFRGSGRRNVRSMYNIRKDRSVNSFHRNSERAATQNRYFYSPVYVEENNEMLLVDNLAIEHDHHLRSSHSENSSCQEPAGSIINIQTKSLKSPQNLPKSVALPRIQSLPIIQEVTINKNQSDVIKKNVENDPVNQISGTSSEIDNDKIQDRRNVLSENMTGRISRLINPSNPKDKAAVSHLISELSKTKKKQNLSRLKMQSGDEVLNEPGNESREYLLEAVNNISPENVCHLPLESSASFEYQSSLTSAINEKSSENKGNTCKAKERKKRASSCGQVKNTALLISEEYGGSSKKKPSCSPKGNSALSEGFSKGSKRKNLSSPKSESKKNCYSSTVSIENCIEDVIKATETHASQRGRENSCPSSSQGKKNNYSSSGSIEKCIEEVVKASEIPQSLSATTEQTPVDLDVLNVLQRSNSNIRLKFEPSDSPSGDTAVQPLRSEDFQNAQSTSKDDINSLESLINLFVTGYVKVKKEFDDPVIDALKTVDPDELVKAYDTSRESLLNSSTNLLDKNSNNSLDKDNSIVDKDNNILAKDVNNSVETLPVIDKYGPLAEQSSLTEVIKNLINELRIVKELEEKSKRKKLEVKIEIQKHRELGKYHYECADKLELEKKQIVKEEEELTLRRNSALEKLQDVVTTSAVVEENDHNGAETTEYQSEHLDPASLVSLAKETQMDQVDVQSNEKCSSETAVQYHDAICEPETTAINKEPHDSPSYLPIDDDGEIYIIPQETSIKSKVPVIDLEAIDTYNISTDTDVTKNDEISSMNDDISSSMHLKKAKNIVEVKNITAHETVVNSMLVYEDFLYTCSNDSTAKRFKLQDPSITVIYHHLYPSKNVTQMCVERVRNKTILFTSCSKRTLWSFIAETGVPLKTYYPKSVVTSLCKGWGILYAGLQDGTILSCNWKDMQELHELVATDTPINSIATAYQGGLHVLVILSNKGQISIRDAQRNGLLIRYVQPDTKPPSFMSIYNDMIYITTADKTLSVINISSGKLERKLSLPSLVTGLFVYDDNIFTISFNGLVGCFYKSNEKIQRIYYGAGHYALTSIYVSEGLVFTGNRNGEVAVFKFEPSFFIHCQVNKCFKVFGRHEDLEYHIENYHTYLRMTRCHWDKCSFIFPPLWKNEEKLKHLNEHLYRKPTH